MGEDTEGIRKDGSRDEGSVWSKIYVKEARKREDWKTMTLKRKMDQAVQDSMTWSRLGKKPDSD